MVLLYFFVGFRHLISANIIQKTMFKVIIDVMDVVLMSLSLTLDKFDTFTSFLRGELITVQNQQ